MWQLTIVPVWLASEKEVVLSVPVCQLAVSISMHEVNKLTEGTCLLSMPKLSKKATVSSYGMMVSMLLPQHLWAQVACCRRKLCLLRLD